MSLISSLASLIPKDDDNAVPLVAKPGSGLTLAWQDKDTNETLSIRFDVVSQESWESVVAITTHPVEDGVDVVDNARDEPRRITLDAYVSNKPTWSNPGVQALLEQSAATLTVPKYDPPLTPGNVVKAGFSAIATAIGGPTPPLKALLLRPKSKGDFPDRARAMYEILIDLQKARTLLYLTSKVGDANSLILVRVNVPRSTEDGNGLSFEMEFQQIRIVSSESVAAPQPAEARGAPQVSKGSKSPKETPNGPKKEELSKSIAASSFDGGRNMLGSLSKLFGGGD